MTGQELCAKLIAIIDDKDATIATAEQIIIGQQRLIELQERKLAAAKKVANDALAVIAWLPTRMAIQTILDAMRGVK